jgi:hypothetical protein
VMFIAGIILMIYLTKKEKNEQNRYWYNGWR